MYLQCVYVGLQPGSFKQGFCRACCLALVVSRFSQYGPSSVLHDAWGGMEPSNKLQNLLEGAGLWAFDALALSPSIKKSHGLKRPQAQLM